MGMGMDFDTTSKLTAASASLSEIRPNLTQAVANITALAERVGAGIIVKQMEEGQDLTETLAKQADLCAEDAEKVADHYKRIDGAING